MGGGGEGLRVESSCWSRAKRRAQTDELGAEPREERWDADGSSVPSARLRISHVLRQLKRTVEAALFHIGVLFRTMGL